MVKLNWVELLLNLQHTKYLVCDAINKKMWNFTASDINPKNLNKPLKLKKEIADLVKRKIFG